MDINCNLQEVKEYTQHLEESLKDPSCFTSEDVERFISKLNDSNVHNFSYDEGASKLVIMPVDRDYVIKIAFTGNSYGYFTGAEGDDSSDYCMAERCLYSDATVEGFEHLFMPIEFLWTEGPTAVYVQPKAEMFIWEDEEQRNYTSKDSVTKIKLSQTEGKCIFSQTSPPISWVANCLDQLDGSIDELERFISFLENYNCYYDLHMGNIGYYHHRAVIVDYGGFQD